MAIKDLLQIPGYSNVLSEELEFRNKNYNYVKANQGSSDIQYSTIADMYLVELTKDNVIVFQGKDACETFNDFQYNLLSNTFFENKTDLRWNIYLLFIADNSNIFENLPIDVFESDDNFARKLFLTVDEAKDFLNRNYYIKSEMDSDFSSTDLPNPLTHWIETLQSKDLTGAIGEFKSSNVKDYIYHNKPFNVDTLNIDSGNDVIRSEESEIYKHIIEVDVSNFRRHCFNDIKRIEPARVNLIHGSNGSGKTSILESMEFAITSEIKHTKDFKGSYENQSASVRLSMSGDTIKTIASSKSKDNCKTFDNKWYGAPITKGNGLCTLNSNYNHFNNFNSETIYSFALEESDDDKNYNYLDKFSRLIFSDELIRFQKNWIRYRDEFDSEFNSVFKSLENKKIELATLKREVSNTESNLVNDDISNDKLCFGLKYKDKIKSELNINDMIVEIEKIQQTFKATEKIASELDTDLAGLSLLTLNSVISEKTGLSTKIQSDKSLLDENLKIKTDKERSALSNNGIINKAEQELVSLNSQLVKAQDTSKSWEKYRVIILNPKVIDEINEITSEKLNIEKKINIISTIRAKYQDIILVDIDKYIPTLKYDINNLNESLKQKVSELSDLKGEIKLAEIGIDRLKQLKVNLNTIASEIIKISEQKNICPLCGEKYIDNEELLKKIRLNIDLSTCNEALLDKLLEKKNNIEKIILDINNKINTFNERENFIEQLKKALLLLNESKLYVINYNDNFEVLYNKIIEVLNNSEDLNKEVAIIESLLNSYEKSGYNNKVIKESNEFKQTNQIIKDYIAEKKDLNLFNEFLSLQISKINNKINEKNEYIHQVNNQTQVIKSEIALLNIVGLNQTITDLNNKLIVYKKVEDNYKILCEYFNLDINDNLPDWISMFRKAIVDLGIKISTLKLTQTKKLKSDELNYLEAEENETKKHFERCKNACEMFKQLKELKHYSQAFIHENRKRIERFFKLLHTPREFKSLELNNDGVVAIRGKDNKIVKMHQMSTGQRTSFAISLILSLYIAAHNAPKFLIFDEPVANLDDLHLLNLLDILRDFALSGTQIFFTTANPEVAGIFRRKFSFFAGQFRHFELSRVNDGYTDIKIVKYIPDSEMGEILAS